MANQNITVSTQRIAELTVENKEFYEKALLKRLIGTTRLYGLAKKKVLPRKSGSTISWRRFEKLALPTKPLEEGVTPDPNNLKITEYKASVKQHGDYIEFSDLVDLVGIDPILTESSELFGEQIAEYIDGLIQTSLLNTANKFYGNGAVAKASAGTITIADLNKMKAWLQKCHVKPWENGKYLFIIDSEQEYDLKSISGSNLIETWKYADTTKIIEGEIGEFMGFRFVVDDLAVNTETVGEGASAVTVHHALVLGKAHGESPFGVIELEGNTGKPSLIYKGLGSAGTADPLDQRQTLGWNLRAFGVTLLYEEAIIDYATTSGLTLSDSYEAEHAVTTRAHYNAASTGANKKTVAVDANHREKDA